MSDIGCIIKRLPAHLQAAAAETAVRENPVNHPILTGLLKLGGKRLLEKFGLSSLIDQLGIGQTPMSPQHIAMMKSKYWGSGGVTLTVSFMESTPSDLQSRIVSHMNAWSDYANVRFVLTNGTGDVRITREADGYWSYLGTDIKHIPANQPTMCLQDFTMQTAESEFHRVVRHETGHTLGCPHEHMRSGLVSRLDVAKTIAYFQQYQGWSEQETRQQVLTPLDEASLYGTPVDQDSIMCYQLPGSITTDGQPIRGGLDINASDGSFMGTMYPKATGPVTPPVNPPTSGGDWSKFKAAMDARLDYLAGKNNRTAFVNLASIIKQVKADLDSNLKASDMASSDATLITDG